MQKDMQKAPTYNVILYFFSLWRQTIFYIPERPRIQVHLAMMLISICDSQKSLQVDIRIAWNKGNRRRLHAGKY